MITLRLNAPNDGNGNPRRLVLVLDSVGAVDAVIVEGYRTRRQATEEFGYSEVGEGPEIVVPVAEYKQWIRWATENDVLRV